VPGVADSSADVAHRSGARDHSSPCRIDERAESRRLLASTSALLRYAQDLQRRRRQPA